MQNYKLLTALVFLIVILAAIASLTGILSKSGEGEYFFTSIHEQVVQIYGKGLYRHMPSDVAVQGIAQDYVTLFIAIPLLILSFLAYRNDNPKARFLLAGTLGYLLVTYLFYLTMGAYNPLFLVYAALLGLIFFSLLKILMSIDLSTLKTNISPAFPHKWVGIFLMINAILIALMWLGIVVPPLLDGTIYPAELFHFTTLIVQGLDIGLLLPLSFVSGLLMYNKTPLGLMAGTVYVVFLSILMTALSAKIIAMAMIGVNVIPAIFIIPLINIITIYAAFKSVKNIAFKPGL